MPRWIIPACEGMPHRVEGDALDFGVRGGSLEAAPGRVAVAERIAVPGREHGIVVLRVRRSQLQRGQVRLDLLRERDAPEGRLGLGRAVFAEARVLPPHVELTLMQINVLPLEAEQLAQPQAGESRATPGAEKRRVYAMGGDGIEPPTSCL
jgi:hypothetical protein